AEREHKIRNLIQYATYKGGDLTTDIVFDKAREHDASLQRGEFDAVVNKLRQAGVWEKFVQEQVTEDEDEHDDIYIIDGIIQSLNSDAGVVGMSDPGPTRKGGQGVKVRTKDGDFLVIVMKA